MENNHFKAKFLDHLIINGKAYYFISVIHPENFKTYVLTSRYSNLLTLHEDLKRTLGQEMLSLSFPPKKWFGNLNPKFIAARKKLLEDYFNSFLTNEKLVKNDLTMKNFETVERMIKNEKISRQISESAGDTSRISISRNYNVRNFFDDYDSHHKQVEYPHKSSFSIQGFDTNKALEDLKKFRNGSFHVQYFLNAYNLVIFSFIPFFFKFFTIFLK